MSVRFPTPRGRYVFAILTIGLGPQVGCDGAGDDAVTPVRVDAGEGGAEAGVGDAGSEGLGVGPAEADGEGSGDAGADGVEEDADPAPAATLSTTVLDLGRVNCGSSPVTGAITVSNSGGGSLVLSASVLGQAFTVSPTSLTLAHGMTGQLTVTATVPSDATAGAALVGSLAIFSNDPLNANRLLPLSATPFGATLSGSPLYAFASSEVGVPATPVAFEFTNTGNASAVIAIGTPSDPSVTINGLPDAGLTLQAGDTFATTASFTPRNAALARATLPLTVGGWTCGSSLPAITFQGQGAQGSIQGWPTGPIDFGPVACGGAAPAPRSITLTNAGLTDARITSVDKSALGPFGVDATSGARIPSGGSLVVTVTAATVPRVSSFSPVTGSVVIHTDADSTATGTTVTLSEEPQGASLSWGSPANGACGPLDPHFGTFGGAPVLLQSSPPQSFCIANAGNVAAAVALVATENGVGGVGGDDAPPDATTGGGAPDPFALSTPSLTVPSASGSNPGAQQDALTFEPVHADATNGTLALTVDATTPLCSPLPGALPLAGSATGGGPVVAPTNLTFAAPCGGSAPAAQSFVVRNDGSANLKWSLGSVQGPGAGQYTVSASPPPGDLAPGAISSVVVQAAAVPSPAPNPAPAAFAASVTIQTDVPFDPPHVVTLGEVPLGDQLSLSIASLRFGEVPIGTSVAQTFVVSNGANAGSPTASVSWKVVSGVAGGTTAYSGVTSLGGTLTPGGSQNESLGFDAPAAGAYPALLEVSSGDALCSPLPGAVGLRGSGTNGALSLSATTLAFGTSPNDPKGLVNCGSTGLPHALTLSNSGNQGLNVTGLTLGKGGSSPFVLSGPATALPFALGIGGSTSITITPNPIPASVADPNDAAAFSDLLTVTSDATGDSPHTVTLVQQPHGAVIASTPVVSAWAFGMVGPGSVGTFTTAIQNTGNGSATLALKQLSLPSIFGMQSNPTAVPANTVAAVVGQFSPPSANGTWEDHGLLEVDAVDAFCAPLPSQWVTPTVDLTGASNSNAVITVAGNLVFPTTDCGGSLPAGQSVTLTNSTNRAYSYSARLASGVFYSLVDGGAGTLAAGGVSTLVVNAKAVSPGPGVTPGAAPYADNLVIDVATSPATAFTVPVSWALNGAVLSLPQGGGPFTDGEGQSFYAADSTSGYPLPMDNGGSASASVSFALQPSGAFEIQPTAPITVLPNVSALPSLVSTSSSSVCPATTSGTATFVYSGPVCQPFRLSTVTVYSCAGTY